MNINLSHLSRQFAALTLIAISYFFLDARLASFFYTLLNENIAWTRLVSNIPDLLDYIVAAIALFSWTVYFYLTRQGIRNPLTRFLQNCGSAIPLAYVIKNILQYVFGRSNPYLWLFYHQPPQFYWFRHDDGYGCFPSGHMTVFTVLLVLLSGLYPHLRPVWVVALCVLGFALVVTNYHFLSDVIAGVYLGVIVAYFVNKILAYSFKHRTS